MEVTPAQLQRVLSIAWNTRGPDTIPACVNVLGPTGCGKTSGVRAFAAGLHSFFTPTADAGLPCLVVQVPLWDPLSSLGLPCLTDTGTVFRPPESLPRAGEGVILLDEISSAPKLNQVLGMQITLARQIGPDYRLPPGWMVISAGNRAVDQTLFTGMLGPLRNRFLFHVSLDPQSDPAGFVKAWAEGWAFRAGIDPSVMGFLEKWPQYIYQHPSSEAQYAFPTPRSWEGLSRALPQIDVGERRLFGGIVGAKAAADFESYLLLCDSIPDLAVILSRPGKAAIPEDPAVRYDAAIMCAYAMSDEARFEKLLQYLERFQEPEYSAVAIKVAMGRKESLIESSAFKKWFEAHKYLYVDDASN